MHSRYKSLVLAKYVIAQDLLGSEANAAAPEKLRAFLKRAIVPALMLLGPVACGTQEGSSKHGNEHAAEKKVNQDLEDQGVKCDIKYQQDGSTLWTFKDSSGDSLQLELPSFAENESVDRNAIDIKKDPKSERMENLKEALLDTFEFGFDHVREKYECDFDSQSRNRPGQKPDSTKPGL